MTDLATRGLEARHTRAIERAAFAPKGTKRQRERELRTLTTKLLAQNVREKSARLGLKTRGRNNVHGRDPGVDDIAALPVKDLAANDAHLFLWITGPLLVEGKHLPIMRAWGFKPSSMMFTWVKLKKSHDSLQLRVLPLADFDLHVGLGLTSRKNAEFCLLGRRGNAKRLAKNIREIMLAPVREHSRKPDETRERIQQYCAGPYLELFARSLSPGWTAWGNEVGKFAVAA